MQLIGQYDTPFVRRVGIAMIEYGLPFEQLPWSVWTDFERIASYSPLRRTPVLVLDDGEIITESWAILDVLDDLMGDRAALMPRSGRPRREAQRLCALATGLSDKAISLLQERVVRTNEQRSYVWTTRCSQQILDTLTALENEASALSRDYWIGGSLSHADIAISCAVKFVEEAHPGLCRLPLSALLHRCAELEARASFRQTRGLLQLPTVAGARSA